MFAHAASRMAISPWRGSTNSKSTQPITSDLIDRPVIVLLILPRASYELQFDFAGRLTARIRPPFDKVVYLYEGQRLKAVYGGAESVTYDYYPTSGLPRRVEVANAETGLRMLAEHKYHIGLLKESR